MSEWAVVSFFRNKCRHLVNMKARSLLKVYSLQGLRVATAAYQKEGRGSIVTPYELDMF